MGKILLFPSTKRNVLCLTPIEATLFLQRAYNQKHKYFTHWFMALDTGMTLSELSHLRWDDICFEKREISVNTRILPMSLELESVLRKLNVSRAGDFVHDDWTKAAHPNNLRHFLKSIGLKQVSFASLRETWRLMLLEAHVSPKKIKELAGDLL